MVPGHFVPSFLGFNDYIVIQILQNIFYFRKDPQDLIVIEKKHYSLNCPQAGHAALGHFFQVCGRGSEPSVERVLAKFQSKPSLYRPEKMDKGGFEISDT